MDGKTLAEDVRKILLEDDSSTFIDDFLTYNFLYEAALQLNQDLRWLTDEYNFQLTVNVKDYTLPANFQELYAMDNLNRHYIRFNQGVGTQDQFCTWRDIDAMEHDVVPNSSQVFPDFFGLRDATVPVNLSGSMGAFVGPVLPGESLLGDSSTNFSGIVAPGDIIHNYTDGSSGYVIQVLNSGALTTALSGGINNYWSGGDKYYLTLQSRMSLHFEPYPNTSGVQVYVPYIKVPDPVYSPYRSYPFPSSYRFPLVKYAAWLYKYRDKEPNYGNEWYKYYEDQLRKSKRIINRQRERTTFRVNYNKRTLTDRSWR
jgi:hypothetical protein